MQVKPMFIWAQIDGTVDDGKWAVQLPERTKLLLKDYRGAILQKARLLEKSLAL